MVLLRYSWKIISCVVRNPCGPTKVVHLRLDRNQVAEEVWEAWLEGSSAELQNPGTGEC